MNWNQFIDRLKAYPNGLHKLLPPCPKDRIDAIECELGVLPSSFAEMLVCFNGAELFGKYGPMITLFGISTIPPLPKMEWATDWYIDKFTPTWRSTQGRPNDWVIGIWNYGTLVILDSNNIVQEWDWSQRTWESTYSEISDWVERVVRDGDELLSELERDQF